MSDQRHTAPSSSDLVDPFPGTNVVFHDRRIFDAERARVFGDAWIYGDHGPRVERIGPLVFSHAGAPDADLRESLGSLAPLADRVAAAAVSLLFETRMEIRGNWKLVVSGAIEDYHLPFVHGTSVNPWRTEPASPTLVPGGHSTYSTPARVGWVPRTLHRMLVGAAPVEQVFENTLIYPNLLLIRLWGIVHVTTFEPLSVGRTLRVTRIYDSSPRRFFADPRRVLRRSAALAFKLGARHTFREDRAIVEEAHAGTLAGRRLSRGPAHEEEVRVEHFLAETARRLRA